MTILPASTVLVDVTSGETFRGGVGVSMLPSPCPDRVSVVSSGRLGEGGVPFARGSSDARLLLSFVTIDCRADAAADEVRSPSNSLGVSAFVDAACVEFERGGRGGGTGRLGSGGGSP